MLSAYKANLARQTYASITDDSMLPLMAEEASLWEDATVPRTVNPLRFLWSEYPTENPDRPFYLTWLGLIS
jgi:hypothetical protein